MKKQQRWTPEEIQILRDNHGKKTTAQIQRELFPYRDYRSVSAKTMSLNLLRPNGVVFLPNKNTFNMSYWKIPNLMNCYLAGFLAADGCIVNKKNSKMLSLGISVKDEQIIDLFIKELNFSGPKYYREHSCSLRDTNIINKYVSFHVHCFNENAKYLEDYFGIINKKTHRLAPSNLVNNYLNWAFIIGLYDGDGHVTFSGRDRLKIVPHLGLTSSSSNILNWVKDFFDKFYPPPRAYEGIHFKTDSENCKDFLVCGLRAAVIIDYLRQFPIPKLARKWDQPEILEFIETSKRDHPEAFKTLDIAEMNASIQRDYPQPAIIDKERSLNYAS